MMCISFDPSKMGTLQGTSHIPSNGKMKIIFKSDFLMGYAIVFRASHLMTPCLLPTIFREVTDYNLGKYRKITWMPKMMVLKR